MTNEQFEKVVNDQLKYCSELLTRKGKEYDSGSSDRLHSLKVAAAMQGISPKQALAGMMAKHTVSVFDMCWEGSHSMEKWTEKITDHINYLLLLKALVQEETNNE